MDCLVKKEGPPYAVGEADYPVNPVNPVKKNLQRAIQENISLLLSSLPANVHHPYLCAAKKIMP